jgi:hypothetical protein
VAGKVPAIEVIDAAELWQVFGGVDKQTSAAQILIAQATSAMTDLARNSAPPDTSTTDIILQLMRQRGPGRGPGSAPALPPQSTLTR